MTGGNRERGCSGNSTELKLGNLSDAEGVDTDMASDTGPESLRVPTNAKAEHG